MMPSNRTRCVFACLLLLVACLACYPSEKTVSEWVSENAVPFVTASVVNDTSDLDCLRELIGDARIVALGEQTHGTSEFQTMKHRIIQYLVEEMGFNVLALEATWHGALIADRYVTQGKIGHRTASGKLAFWFYSTTEFQALLQWMRSYNTTSPETPLHLVGIDYGFPQFAFEWIEATMSSARIILPSSVRAAIDEIDTAVLALWQDDIEARYAFFDLAQSTVADVLALLPDYESSLSALEISILERIPALLEQAERRQRIADTNPQPNAAGWTSQFYNFRDQAMAENVAWWLDILGENTKMIIWAHNGHVATSWPEAGWVPLGQNLSNRFREAFLSIGFSTCSGTFFAFNSQVNALGSLPIPEPAPDSYESVFCGTGIANFFLDLRNLPTGSPVRAWMNQSRGFKVLGASPDIVNGLVVSAYDTNGVLPNMFDIVIHIQNTKAIRYIQ